MLTITAAQTITLVVLLGVVIALILDTGRPEIVSLTGAAVIAYAMERSGLLDQAVRAGVWIGRRFGGIGIWTMILGCGSASAFLNNSPIVIMAAPVVRGPATSLRPMRAWSNRPRSGAASSSRRRVRSAPGGRCCRSARSSSWSRWRQPAWRRSPPPPSPAPSS